MESPNNFKFRNFYNQFFIDDGENSEMDLTPYIWNEADLKIRLYSIPGELSFFTQSYGDVNGNFIFLEKEPENLNLIEYDHIVEGNIEIKSGRINIVSWGGNIEKSCKVENGIYRIRILGSNFKSVIESDVPNESDDDFYEIQIWKSDEKGIKVIKQYPINY